MRLRLLVVPRLVGALGIAAVALASGCGSSGDAPDPGVASADASAGSESPTLAFSDGGAPSSNGDGGEECGRLNIGILGAPGPLPSSNFQDWLVAAGTSATRIQTDASKPLTSAELAPFDVVVLDALVREYNATEADQFAAWAASGGGVIAMTGYTDTATDLRANSLITKLGVTYATPQIWGPAMTFAPHPTTLGLKTVTFVGGYQVVPVQGTTSQLLPLATIQTSTIAYAIERAKGRAFVWGDEWIEYDSEWRAIPEITQLWVNVFAWLAPAKCALTPPPPR